MAHRQPHGEWMRRTKVDKRCGRSHDNAIATTGHRLPLAHLHLPISEENPNYKNLLLQIGTKNFHPTVIQ